MNTVNIEHLNVTVSNPEQTADLLCGLFGWHIRWQGDSMMGGRTVHVGSENSYLALYTHSQTVKGNTDSYSRRGGLNHVGVVVDDLDLVEQRVLAAGLEPNNHGDYEPGRRFYFDDHDGIEYEVVHYPHKT